MPEGMVQLSEKQLKEISRKLGKEAEIKSNDQIQSEVANTLSMNRSYDIHGNKK